MSRRWLPPALWAAFLLVLTSLPGDAVPEVGDVPPGTDKLVHAVLYAVLGWLVARAISHPRHPAGSFILIMLGLAVFAALDEWHQAFIPGREPNVMDWVADVSGAMIGAGLGAQRWRREQAS